jgi:hypothetical protein
MVGGGAGALRQARRALSYARAGIEGYNGNSRRSCREPGREKEPLFGGESGYFVMYIVSAARSDPRQLRFKEGYSSCCEGQYGWCGLLLIKVG